MPLPPALRSRLRLPVVVAPMFLVSSPALVIASCKAGVLGTVPAANARPSSEFEAWVREIDGALAGHADAAPWGANLSVHRNNARLDEDLDIVVRHKVPVVVTILGKPDRVVRAVHSYGGIVLHDAATERHARNAAAAGVDGIIALAGGAGGHTGWQNPFSLVREIRRFWDGCLILAGAISDGYGIRAAEVLGADLAYMGTRFTATRESAAPEAMKQMIVDCKATDILCERQITGIDANYMIPSLTRMGIDVEKLRAGASPEAAGVEENVRSWRDLWSAGHGVSVIDDIPPVSELVDRLEREYLAACGVPASGRDR